MADENNSYQVLVACIGKTEEEIQSIVKTLNLECPCIIRNQNARTERGYSLSINNQQVDVINVMHEEGASKNRNELLKISTAKYIFFMDDDCAFVSGYVDEINNKIMHEPFDGLKFISKVTNPNRGMHTNKPINKTKISYYNCSDTGVWAFVFSREFLIKNKIVFDENMGPGTPVVKASEDLLFLKKCFQNKAYFSPLNKHLVNIQQMESTWFKGIDEGYLVTVGGSYKALYPFLYPIFYIRFIIKKRKSIKISIFKTLKLFKIGRKWVQDNVEI